MGSVVGKNTYTKDSGVIRDRRRLRLRCSWLLNAEVLDIAATEDDIIVDLIRRGYKRATAFTALGTKGLDIFKRNCRVFRVDLMKSAYIATGCLLTYVS